MTAALVDHDSAPLHGTTHSVDRALNLLNALGDPSHGKSLTELSQRASLSKSTAFRLLNTLRAAGMVDRVGTTYSLGGQLLRLAGQAPEAAEVSRRNHAREIAMPFLQAMYSKTGSTVHLAALDGVRVLYLEKLFGHWRVSTPSKVGGHFAANASAIGKSMLALAGDDVIDAAMEVATAPTADAITDPELMYRELERVQRAGYATDLEEARIGLSCVASAFRADDGSIFALSISSETQRFRLDEHAPLVRHAASSVCRAMNAVPFEDDGVS